MLKCLFIKIKRKYQKPREKHTKILANLFYGYSLILLLLWIRAIVWGHSRPKSAVLNVELTELTNLAYFIPRHAHEHTHSTHKECVRERAKREREWKRHAAARRECVREAEATKKVNVAFAVPPITVPPVDKTIPWPRLIADSAISLIENAKQTTEERAPRDVRWVPDEVNEI